MTILKDIRWNHDRPLSDFQDSLNIIEDCGFKPIAVSQMYLEDVFVFETSHEATVAYEHLEKGNNVENKRYLDGWWYGRDDFLREVKAYETDNKGFSKVLIHWLNK